MAIKSNVYLRLKQMNAIKFKTDMSPFTLHTIFPQLARNRKQYEKFVRKKKKYEEKCGVFEP